MKIKTLLILWALAILFNNSNAQTVVFQKSFGTTGDESANSVFQTFDKGYIVSGNTEGAGSGNYDAWLTKLDSNANIVWSKTYGSAGLDYGNFAIQTTDSGYLIAGGTVLSGAGGEEIVITKTDAVGNITWAKQFGNLNIDEVSTLQAVQQTADGGYIVTGIASLDTLADIQTFLMKLNSNGDTLWTKIYAGPGSDQGKCVRSTLDGGYILCGRSSSFGSSMDVFLIKTDSMGNVQWSKNYGGSNWDEGMCVRQLPDSGYVVAGGTTTFSIGSYDIMLMRMDANGTLMWTKGYGGINSDAGYSMALTDDGNMAVVGFTESYNSNLLMGTDSADVILIKTDLNGDTLWVRDYGGLTKDEAFGISTTEDKGFVIAAVSNSFTADSLDGYVIKTDSLGNCLCSTKSVEPTITNGAAWEFSFNWPVFSGFTVQNANTIATPFTPLDLTMCFGVITGIADHIKNKTEVTVSPNPFFESTHIQISRDHSIINDQLQFTVYDVTGKEVSTFCELQISSEPNHLTIDFKSKLRSGVYFLTVSGKGVDKNEIIETVKLIVI